MSEALPLHAEAAGEGDLDRPASSPAAEGGMTNVKRVSPLLDVATSVPPWAFAI